MEFLDISSLGATIDIHCQEEKNNTMKTKKDTGKVV
jgi:hypothetical protein